MPIKARSAKAKGTRLEKDVVADLLAAGIQARRQPGSGIYSAFPHDVEATIHDKRYIIECKQRKDSFRTLDRYLGAADLLIVRLDRGGAKVYMDWGAFLTIVQGGSNDG